MNLQGKNIPGTHNFQQQRQGHFNINRDSSQNQLVGHTQRPEDLSRQGPGYPQQALRQLGPVDSASGAPHDMSKQATLPTQVPNNPGLYTTAPGGVLGPGLHPQAAMPAPNSVGSHQTAGVVQQHQPQQMARQGNIQLAYGGQYQQNGTLDGYFYSSNQRPQIHRPPMNWTANPMSIASQPQPAGAPQYPNQIPVTHIYSPNNFQPLATHQAAMMRSATPVPGVSLNYPQFATNPQYSVPSSQTNVYISPHGSQYAYGQQRSAVSFYTPLPPGMLVQTRSNLSTINPNPPPPQLRERKIIRIVDPQSMIDITYDIIGSRSQTPPVSGSSSVKGTPPPDAPPGVSDVAVQFAAQVAMVATPRKESLPKPAVLQSLPHEETLEIPTEESDLDLEKPPSPELTEEMLTEDEEIPINAVDEAPDSSATTFPSSESFEEICSFEPTGVHPIPLDVEDEPVDTPNMEELDAVHEEPVDETVYSNMAPAPVVILNSSSKEFTIRRELDDQPRFETPPEESTNFPATESIVTQQNGELLSESLPSSPPGSLEAKEITEAKEMKKIKKKKKSMELNKKGESKEGGDMDAFVDVNEVPSVTLSSPPCTSPTPEEEMTEEERKVAEKNEENTRVSQETPVIEHIKPLLPKYDYKEDQWSPLNPEGKKQYDRAFLLTMQSQPMSLRKPEGLPNLEVIKDTAIQHKLPDMNRPAMASIPMRNHPDVFMPQYARQGTPRPPQGGMMRRQSAQREKPKKIISISTSLNEGVKLHESENAWKPTHKVQPEIDEETIKTEELYKKVRGILNKLTPQKFKMLVGQVHELPITTETRLKGVIDLVFEKAVDEPNFSVPYANMCKCLAMKAVPSDADGQNVNFRKLLLTKCQREFEKDSDEVYSRSRFQDIDKTESEEKRKQLTEELEEELRKARRRSLGNIRFIGELFKLGMLTSAIMHECIKKLLHSEDEDSLECLCRLLSTVGKELDAATDKTQKSRDDCSFQMEKYFDTMKKIVTLKATSSRVRFMLQDVIELRSRLWIPRRDENNPKTIDQIHQEAAQEAQEQQQILQHQPSIPKRVDDRDRRGGGGKNRSNMHGYAEEGGWNTVGGKNSRSSFGVYDSRQSITKITKPIEAETIQLGPGGKQFQSWSRGSSGGSKLPAQEAESKSNRFSALNNQEPQEAGRPMQRSSASNRETSRGRGSQGPPASLKKTPSQSKDMEKAIAAVKAISGIEPKFEEPKEVIEPEVKQPDPMLSGKPLTEDELEKHIKPLIDEFLHNSDFKEAIQCITELVSPSQASSFVLISINHVLERSSQARQLLGQLLHTLVRENVIALPQYISGLKSILELTEEYSIDIPKIWKYLGELIAPMVQDGSVPLTFLKEAAEPCITTETGGKLMSNILHTMAEHVGPTKVWELWKDSSLQWSDFLPENDDIAKFIKENQLDFTVSESKRQPISRFSPEQVRTHLNGLLKRHNNNEEIFDWIEGNVGEERIREKEYIRALVTAVAESSMEGEDMSYKVDVEKLKSRVVVLQRYIENKDNLELNALFALQALSSKLQHPKGVLVSIFEALYDDDVISEDAFNQWDKNTDPAEQLGKGVARKSVTTFFTWLKEAEEESDGDI